MALSQIWQNYSAIQQHQVFLLDLKNLPELLRSHNLNRCSVLGYEADDVLSTLARKGGAGRLGEDFEGRSRSVSTRR